MKYYVIAVKWSDKVQKQVKYIAGVFSEYVNASKFARAYSDTYKTDTEIVNDIKLLNE